MTPRQAYDDVSQRARLLLKLYDGLTDTRKRGIRNDWRRSFCKFMRWNRQRRSAGLTAGMPSSFSAMVRDCGAPISPATHWLICSASLTIGVSAVDRYVHERVVKNVVKALKRSNLNSTQREFSIPAVLAIRLATTVARARNSTGVVGGGRCALPTRSERPSRIVAQAPSAELARDPTGARVDRGFGLDGKMQTRYHVANIGPIRSS